jgi:hypothetical protein
MNVHKRPGICPECGKLLRLRPEDVQVGYRAYLSEDGSGVREGSSFWCKCPLCGIPLLGLPGGRKEWHEVDQSLVIWHRDLNNPER